MLLALVGLTAEYPATLKQPLKIGVYVDTQSLRIHVSTYPLSHWVSTYSCIDFDIHLRQHIKLIVRLFVILKATEGRKVHKRHNYVSMYLALSGILLQSGRVFCSCSHI